MYEQNQRLQVQLMRSIGSQAAIGRDTFELRITDSVSGIRILNIKLDPEAFADLMSSRITGSVEGVPAWVNETEELGLIGQHLAVVSAPVPNGHWNADDSGHVACLENWARAVAINTGADKWSVSWGSQMLAVQLKRYFDTKEEAAAWRPEAYATAADLRVMSERARAGD
jgi:hypothetical protein